MHNVGNICDLYLFMFFTSFIYKFITTSVFSILYTLTAPDMSSYGNHPDIKGINRFRVCFSEFTNNDSWARFEEKGDENLEYIASVSQLF